MKKTLRLTALLLVFILGASLLFGGCKKEEDAEKDKDTLVPPTYSEENIESFIKLGQYKDITINAKEETSPIDVALWNKVVANAEVIVYPEDAITYYKGQIEKSYEFLASNGDMSYDELLLSLRVTNEDILNEAKEYIKSDLVKIALVKAEGLHLSDEEKSRLFDKYVEKFTTTYSYTEEHVREKLADEIYDTMQYDKMMEFLMLNNTIVTSAEE